MALYLIKLLENSLQYNNADCFIIDAEGLCPKQK